MMKSSLIDETNKEIEQVMFTSLRLFEDGEKLVLDSLPEIAQNYTLICYHRGVAAVSMTTDNAWQLDEALGGFWCESVLRRTLPDTDHIVQQMVYTDGLASP